MKKRIIALSSTFQVWLDHGCSNIKVVLNDNDVVIICIVYYHFINNIKKLWLIFGIGKSKIFIPIHTIAEQIGREKCKALLGFLAIIGCDSVSTFYGRGKKQAWKVWNKFPAVTEAFTTNNLILFIKLKFKELLIPTLGIRNYTKTY